MGPRPSGRARTIEGRLRAASSCCSAP